MGYVRALPSALRRTITPPAAKTDQKATSDGLRTCEQPGAARVERPNGQRPGVTGYNIMRGSVKIGTATTPGYTDNTVSASTTYSYTVTAYDAAGNTAQPSVECRDRDDVRPTFRGADDLKRVAERATATTATITWTTDKLSDTQVAYGTSAAYNIVDATIDSARS